jgi:hypothetical protein
VISIGLSGATVNFGPHAVSETLAAADKAHLARLRGPLDK